MKKLSYSKIAAFKNCELRFYYQYIKKLPRVQWDHFDLGTFTHYVLEVFYEVWRKDPNLDPRKAMSYAFNKAIKKFGQMRQAILAQAKAFCKDYLKYILYGQGTSEDISNNIYNEFEFKFKVREFEVEGKIDRVDKLGNNYYEIIDYKTTKNEDSVYNGLLQLYLYGCAMVKMYGRDIKILGSYYLIRHKKKVSFDITNDLMQKGLREVVNVGNSINNAIKLDKWEANPTFLCNWCDFKTVCPHCSWSKNTKKIVGRISRKSNG